MHLNAQYLPFNIIASLLEDIISDLGARLYIFYLAIIKRITLGQFAFYISRSEHLQTHFIGLVKI